MKRFLVVTAVTLCAAGMVWGTLGQVVASWRAPADYPLCLARAPNVSYMWLWCNRSPYTIYRVHSDTGSVYSSYVHPRATNYVRGLTFSYGSTPPYSGSYLWVGNYSNDYVYMSNYTTGSVYRSYSVAHDPYGLAVQATADGGQAPTAMLTSDSSPAYVWRRQLTTGSIMSSFGASGLYDIAYDWRNKLVWGRSGSTIVGRDVATGSITASFTSPPGPALAFTYYGQYLWIGTTTSYHRIYKVHCPFPVSVAPASLGKVKAIFH